jgi:hypothetical protein
MHIVAGTFVAWDHRPERFIHYAQCATIRQRESSAAHLQPRMWRHNLSRAAYAHGYQPAIESDERLSLQQLALIRVATSLTITGNK